MTPPGDRLDFHESPFFTARTVTMPEIRETAKKAIRDNLHKGNLVIGPVRRFALSMGRAGFVIFYSKHGIDIGLMAIYEDTAKGMIEDYEQKLKDLFKKGGLK